MAVTGIPNDAPGPENPGDKGRIRILQFGSLQPNSSDLLHPLALVMVMVVAGWAGSAVVGALRGGGLARARRRDTSLHLHSTPLHLHSILHLLLFFPVSVHAPSRLSLIVDRARVQKNTYLTTLHTLRSGARTATESHWANGPKIGGKCTLWSMGRY